MLFDANEDTKRYYTISEVATRFGVNQSLIRFWEREFDFFRPHKNGRGARRFTKENLAQLQLIFHLVKERGFTLEGARQEITRRQQWEEERAVQLQNLLKIKEGLLALRHQLAPVDRPAQEEE